MSRYLMCAYGAAQIVQEPPEHAESVAVIAVTRQERYRVLRTGRALYAVQIPALESYGWYGN